MMDLSSLTIKPYATEVFTDHKRGRAFTRLFYQLRDVPRAKALGLTERVLDDLAAANLTAKKGIVATFTVRPGGQMTVHLAVPLSDEGGSE